MTATVSTPDPSEHPLVAFGQRAVRAYIDSLPPDHPERIAWDQAMADLRAGIDDACAARGVTREEMLRVLDELTNPTEGDANP